MYSKFVELAIGQINPNVSLSSVGKKCKRLYDGKNVTMQESELPPPTQPISLNGTCELLQIKIDETLENG